MGASFYEAHFSSKKTPLHPPAQGPVRRSSAESWDQERKSTSEAQSCAESTDVDEAGHHNGNTNKKGVVSKDRMFLFPCCFPKEWSFQNN